MLVGRGLVDHFGVLKAFLDANLMPRVFNGTSAGTLAACTYPAKLAFFL